MSNRSRQLSRGDQRRNERLATLRSVVTGETAVLAVDLAADKQVFAPEPVKPSEADSSRNHCAVAVSSFGSLIQAAVGSTGGSGALRTKRSGCAA